MDRDAFEEWVKPRLWGETLERSGGINGPYRSRAVQLAFDAWQESRRGGFVSTGPVDLELP